MSNTIINSDQSYTLPISSAAWTQLSPPTVAAGGRAFNTSAGGELVLTNNGTDEIFIVKATSLGTCPAATAVGARGSGNLIASLLPNQGIALPAPVGGFPDHIKMEDYWALALVDQDPLTVRPVQ